MSTYVPVFHPRSGQRVRSYSRVFLSFLELFAI